VAYVDIDPVAVAESLEMVAPGSVWLPEWRPAQTDPADFVDDPRPKLRAGWRGRRK